MGNGCAGDAEDSAVRSRSFAVTPREQSTLPELMQEQFKPQCTEMSYHIPKYVQSHDPSSSCAVGKPSDERRAGNSAATDMFNTNARKGQCNNNASLSQSFSLRSSVQTKPCLPGITAESAELLMQEIYTFEATLEDMKVVPASRSGYLYLKRMFWVQLKSS